MIKRNPRTASGWFLLDLLLVALSGVAMWAAFPAIDWWFLTVPSLALLIGLVDRISPLRAGAYSALWAMIFFLPHISWMQIATDGTWIAWFALAAAQAFFISLWGASFAAMGVWSWARTIAGEALGGALLWVAFEELRSRIPFGGFAWAKLGYAQVDSPFIVYSPIGGEVLVGFVVFAVAVLLRRAFAVVPHPVQDPPVWARFAAIGVAAALTFAPAFVRLPNAQQVGSVNVGVIQGNIEVPMAQTFGIPRKVTGNHVRQTLALLDSGAQPEVIFWGEHSVDIDPRTDPETATLIAEAAEAAGVPIVIGFMEYGDSDRTNWLAVWDPEEGFVGPIYGKQHPVPWGEYIPMREITLKLATAAAQISVDMVPVDNPGFVEVELADGRTLPLAVGICFEVAYEPIISEGVRMGGQLIVIPTNNAHFKDSPESLQQLQMARFRAAQFSRSALQVSTNGVSAIIRPDGTVLEMTGMQEAAFLDASVPLRTSMTFSAWQGEASAWAAMTLGGTLAMFSLGAYLYWRGLWKAHATNRQKKPGRRG